MHVAWCGCVDIVDIQVTKLLLLLLLLLLVLWPDLMPACLPACLFWFVCLFLYALMLVNVGRLMVGYFSI